MCSLFFSSFYQSSPIYRIAEDYLIRVKHQNYATDKLETFGHVNYITVMI